MRNKKGFIFIETILTVVVLLTTLVVLYSNYAGTVINEKRRLYYDDVAYVYKTAYIRDVLMMTLDQAKFKTAVENKRREMLFYVFNYESKIFTDNTALRELQSKTNFARLVYIALDDLDELKSCINMYGNYNIASLDASDICQQTVITAKGYADATFIDYLKTIHVPNTTKSDGIIISLIYESKNGGKSIAAGTYDNCIQREVFRYFNVNNLPESEDSHQIKLDALKEYEKTDSVNFDMTCENAYYNSWVYL